MRTWTDAQRKDAATRIRKQTPWKHSTGPRTPLGKRISSRNSYKHGRFTYERQLIRWYLRVAIHRNKQIRTHINHFFYNRENEVIAKYGLPKKIKPYTMAFYPYFKVHPLHNAWSQPKRRKKISKEQEIFDYFTSLSGES